MIIIGICGKKQVGKDTFADFGCELLSNMGITCAKSSFASPLKRFVVDYLGVPDGLPEGTNEDKATVMGKWGDYLNPELCSINNAQEEDDINVRELLQVYGTDVFRGVHSNFWINVFNARVKNLKFDEVHGAGSPEVVFITDVRFHNEVEAINDLGGYAIKLDRLVYSDSHKSEASVDLIPEDLFYKVFRQEDLDGLAMVKELVEKTISEIGVNDVR